MKIGALAGKTAVVTGAGRGIGRILALGFAEAGAGVVLAARSEAQLSQVAAEIEAAGGHAAAVPTDLADAEQTQHLFAVAAQRFDVVDILVANAGVSLEPGRVADSDPCAWRQTMDGNLLGTYHTAKFAIPLLRQSEAGKMILVGSGLGMRGAPGGSAYGCAKAALHLLMQCLATELIEDGIAVNELIPGPVRTGLPRAMDQRVGDSPGAENEWNKEPEDVLPLALFLATQPSLGPTGQTFSLMRRLM